MAMGPCMDITIEIDLAQAARDLGLPLESVQNTVALLDEGNTVPFITRYRKEPHGLAGRGADSAHSREGG